LLRAPGAKALALLWGPLVSLAVVVTGNHYVFDIAAGLVVTAIGYAITRPIRRGRRRGVLVHVRLADAAQGDPVRELRGLP
jgi:membrane-associated phospholipid phosphatase